MNLAVFTPLTSTTKYFTVQLNKLCEYNLLLLCHLYRFLYNDTTREQIGISFVKFWHQITLNDFC